MAVNSGRIPEEIYRGHDRWHLDHLPPIANQRNHTILFQYPILIDQSKPPEPCIGRMKWDLNHVRLPCATENEFSADNVVRYISHVPFNHCTNMLTVRVRVE